MRNCILIAAAALLLLIAACAPAAGTGTAYNPPDLPCMTDPIPTVAVIDFENTTSRTGTHVTGVEEAATARLITLLKASDCYEVVEQSVLQDIIMEQGLESMEPADLARAAGAGYVITGTVTRATIAKPNVNAFGVSLGATSARVEVDVRATDIITGRVLVAKTESGEASSPNVAVSRIPTAGRISFNDPEVGPILADASNIAVNRVMSALRTTF